MQSLADMGGSGYFADEVAAPHRALELTLGTGYTQGFGRLQQGVPVGDTSDASSSVELGAAYRLSLTWALGVTGGYQTFRAGDELTDDAGPDGATARIDAILTWAPTTRARAVALGRASEEARARQG